MLRLTAIAEHKSLSGATSAIDVALNHNAPTVGQLAEQTPDTFSIMDMTERVVELEVVNNVLLPRQRNTDKEPTMDDPAIRAYTLFPSALSYYQSTYGVPICSELLLEHIWHSHLL